MNTIVFVIVLVSISITVTVLVVVPISISVLAYFVQARICFPFPKIHWINLPTILIFTKDLYFWSEIYFSYEETYTDFQNVQSEKEYRFLYLSIFKKSFIKSYHMFNTKKESYLCMFSLLNNALEALGLELSANYFMSNFEVEIRDSFLSTFHPYIP